MLYATNQNPQSLLDQYITLAITERDEQYEQAIQVRVFNILLLLLILKVVTE